MKRLVKVLLVMMVGLLLLCACENKKEVVHSYRVDENGVWLCDKDECVLENTDKQYIGLLEDGQLIDVVLLEDLSKTVTNVGNASVYKKNNVIYINDDSTSNIVIKTSKNDSENKLVIDAPNDNIYHYGSIKNIDIKAVATSSYHEYGEVDSLSLNKGRVVLEEYSSVNEIFLDINHEDFDYENTIIALNHDKELPLLVSDVTLEDNETIVFAKVQYLDSEENVTEKKYLKGSKVENDTIDGYLSDNSLKVDDSSEKTFIPVKEKATNQPVIKVESTVINKQIVANTTVVNSEVVSETVNNEVVSINETLEPIITTTSSVHTHSLDASGICSVCHYGAIAKIGNTYYASLEKAFENVTDGQTITLIDNLSVVDKEYVLENDISFTLDGNGKAINASVSNDSIRMLFNLNPMSKTYNVDLKDITINSTGYQYTVVYNSDDNGYYTVNGNLNNVNITSEGVALGVSGNDYRDSDVVLDDCNMENVGPIGNFNGFIYTVLAPQFDGKITVNSGTYTGTNYCGYVYTSGGTLVINDGTFVADTVLESDYSYSYSTVHEASDIIVNGGSFEGELSTNGNPNASIEISGGTFDSEPLNSFIKEGYEAMEVEGEFVVTEVVVD